MRLFIDIDTQPVIGDVQDGNQQLAGPRQQTPYLVGAVPVFSCQQRINSIDKYS